MSGESEKPVAMITIDGYASPEDVARVRQCYEDGAAIHHLWDALADLPDSEVVVSITRENVEITVIAHGERCDDERNDFVEMTAPTIAEAADKCREVLS